MNRGHPSKAVAVLSMLFVTTSLVLLGFIMGHTHGTYAGMEAGIEAGMEAGAKAAINPRNPSEELEMACAGLWIGEQNRKYLEMEQKK